MILKLLSHRVILRTGFPLVIIMAEINTPIIPLVIEGAGAFRSTASDLLEYVPANLGFLHTKLDASIQLQHLIRHSKLPANPMNYSEYIALGWRVLTNFGRDLISYWIYQRLGSLCRLHPYKTRWCCIVV
jgi:hypothetical protein